MWIWIMDKETKVSDILIYEYEKKKIEMAEFF